MAIEKIPANAGATALALLVIYIIESVVLGIAPYDRTIWWSENIIGWLCVAALALMYWRGIRFSATAYILMSLFLYWHTVGGHYTFERVPFDWVSNLIGAERNHFDRVSHFAVGFFAWPYIEFVEMKKLSNSRVFTAVTAIAGILAFAGFFELVEWQYAANAAPEAGAAFLGSQGDIWDAQKDMTADTLGAIVTTAAYAFFRWRKPSSPSC